MREPRNPFKLRASEHIESDTTFLRLFEPGILEMLSEESWKRLLILRSAAGGGKTSLMRLFTPTVLLTLHAYRSTTEYRDVYLRLQTLGVIDEPGPRVLGIMLSCAKNYASLADMELDEARKIRLLYALLNARIILAALRGAMSLRNLQFPEDLGRVSIAPKGDGLESAGIKFPCNGKALYDWASRLEASVCYAIDSFEPGRIDTIQGHEGFVSLSMISPESLSVDGKPIAEHFILMLDDVQKLTRRQRSLLLDHLVNLRHGMGIWIAERFEGMTSDELLSPGAIQGRDYEAVIELESYWREKKRFEKIALGIADRRAQAATEVEVSSFGPCLQESLDAAGWKGKLEKALSEVKERIKSHARSSDVYKAWIEAREHLQVTTHEQLTAWRTLEILIERESRKAQKTFDFLQRSEEELADKDGSDVNGAAELFVSGEHSLPFYYGPGRLATLASSNIEQFLWLGGEVFEEVVSAILIKKSPVLSPERQEEIVLASAEARWAEIPQRVRNGRDVRAFLEAVGKFARWMTYKPNAPYSPGVTGIAISMGDRNRLLKADEGASDPELKRLADVLTSALAHNLLEPVLDYKCKGQRWMVMYFNRLLCAHFRLPLQYGGFKEKTLKDLCGWLEKGFQPPKKGEDLL
jgi:hypothetical protein